MFFNKLYLNFGIIKQKNMKTSLWQKILAWLKINNHLEVVVLTILCLAAMILITIGVNRIVNQAKKIAILEFDNSKLAGERALLDKKVVALEAEKAVFIAKNDSMKLVLAAKERQLQDMRARHKREIDSLLNNNVPNDTVYRRLQPIYPNLDGSPLEYPFSGSQIRQIYGTALAFPRLSDEYMAQGNSLKACYTLNDGFEKLVSNQEQEIGLLKENIGKADKQIANYNTEVGILKRDNKRQKFWKKAFLTGLGIVTGIAILK